MGLNQLVAVGAVLSALTCSGVAGWDPSRSVSEIGLAAAVLALIWLASRSRPPEVLPAVLAVGLAGLALWGIWQVVTGFEAIRPGIDELATPARVYAEERVASGRAFASLPLPSHLAILLATALPLLLARVRAAPRGIIWIAAAVLAVLGLIATRSPVGLGLAVLTVAPVLVVRHRAAMLLVVGSLIAAIVVIVVIRPDVAKLEPVSLRLDNWRTGVWLWTTSPASGVGVASFAQASQANPVAVENRPAHAHSLPFEALAELGPAGLAGVLLLGIWLFRLMRDVWKSNRGLALAIAVVPLHNLLDFSLFVAGVALPWAVLIGWAVAHRNHPGEGHTAAPAWGRIALVAAVSAVLGVAILQWTSGVVEEVAASSTDSQEQFDGAQQALRMGPWRVRPQFLLASAAINSGSPSLQDRAWFELDRFRWLRPRSAALAERRAQLALARGDVSSALSELWIAAAYGSPDSASAQSLAELIDKVEKTGHDAAR